MPSNPELLEAAFGAYRDTGDIGPSVALLSPDVQWFAAHEGVEPCRSREDVIHVWEDWAAQPGRVKAEEFIAAGDRVIVVARAPDGTTLVTTFTMRDGKIVHMQDNHTRDAALAALGNEA